MIVFVVEMRKLPFQRGRMGEMQDWGRRQVITRSYKATCPRAKRNSEETLKRVFEISKW
jgi:hypothetical protein